MKLLNAVVGPTLRAGGIQHKVLTLPLAGGIQADGKYRLTEEGQQGGSGVVVRDSAVMVWAARLRHVTCRRLL